MASRSPAQPTTNVPYVVVPTNNPDDPAYIADPGSVYDAVVNISGSGITGSGVLLSTGKHILTVAHVVDTMSLSGIQVNFDLPSGRVTLGANQVFIHEGWQSNWGNDIAIIELAETAPVAGFDIYRNTDEIGQLFTLYGYGVQGTGNTGTITPDYDVGDIKRFGLNKYEALNTDFGYSLGNSDPGSILFYDFDDGSSAHDALGNILGIYDTGLGALEVNSSGGDSGGPTFITTSEGPKIAGLVSGGSSLGDITDITTGIDSSFGEVSHDTRVSFFADWIDNVINSTTDTTEPPVSTDGTFTPWSSLSQLIDHIEGDMSGASIVDITHTGLPGQSSVFDSINFGNNQTLGRGILLTSGDGTPPEVNTSEGYSFEYDSPGDTALTEIVQSAFSYAGETHDANVLELAVDVTSPNITSLSLDLIFGSDEYPEWADSEYVDIAAITNNGTNYALFSNGQPLSILQENINHGGIAGNTGQPIEYDGLTSKLTVSIPVSLGTNNIRIGIADTGDTALDSGLFVSNLRTESSSGTGIKLEIQAPPGGGEISSAFPDQDIAESFIGSTGDDIINAGGGDDKAVSTAGNNTFNMGDGNDYAEGGQGADTFNGGNGQDTLVGGGGADNFQGTAAELNGDYIVGFSTEAAITLAGSIISGAVSIGQITPSQNLSGTTNRSTAQALMIDTDGDGNQETSIYLQGDFSQGNFVVTQTQNGSKITYESTQITFPTAPGNNLFLTGNNQSVATGFDASVFNTSGSDILRLGADTLTTLAVGAQDTIELPGALADYEFTLQGNQLGILNNQNNGAVLTLSGDAGTLAFADGSASLTLTGLNQGTLGAAALSATTTTLSSADIGAGWDTSYTSGSTVLTLGNEVNKLFLDGSSQNLNIDFNAQVFGSSTAAEMLNIATGTQVEFSMSSQDEIQLNGNLADYTFQLAGNLLSITDAAQTDLTLVLGGPAGTLSFQDASAALELTGLNQASLGGATLSDTPTTLSPSELSSAPASQANSITLVGNMIIEDMFNVA